MDNEFTDGRSYCCGSRGRREELEGKVRDTGFAEDKASVLFGDVKRENIWETPVRKTNFRPR